MNAIDETVTAPPPRRKKNTSERQLRANQANAQKSTGPRTEPGKSVSKYNNLSHGLTCFMVCLPGEDKEQYEAIRAEYHDFWQPANIVERGLVDDLVAARWRKNRIIRTENGLVRERMVRMRHDKEIDDYDQLSVDVEVSLAIKSLADRSKIAERMDRYENRLERNFARVLKQLTDLKRLPPIPLSPDLTTHNSQLTTVQTEPIPTNEHPADPEPDPEPIGGATAPNTISLKPPTKPLTMTAGSVSSLATGHWPPATSSPTPLTTRPSPLTTHN